MFCLCYNIFVYAVVLFISLLLIISMFNCNGFCSHVKIAALLLLVIVQYNRKMHPHETNRKMNKNKKLKPFNTKETIKYMMMYIYYASNSMVMHNFCRLKCKFASGGILNDLFIAFHVHIQFQSIIIMVLRAKAIEKMMMMMMIRLLLAVFIFCIVQNTNTRSISVFFIFIKQKKCQVSNIAFSTSTHHNIAFNKNCCHTLCMCM